MLDQNVLTKKIKGRLSRGVNGEWGSSHCPTIAWLIECHKKATPSFEGLPSLTGIKTSTGPFTVK